MRYSELVETPRIIGDEDGNLSNRRANAVRAAGILNDKPEVLEQFATAELVRLAGDASGPYGLISTRDHLLEYYAHYETATHPLLGRCATQVKLWRSRTATVQGMAAKVFDHYLLGTFDSIVSDARQTARGQEFWEVQMAGHSHSHVVGLLVRNQINLYDRRLSMADWLVSINGWGAASRYREMRFFISNLQITQLAHGPSQ